jgi:hypothetical protein
MSSVSHDNQILDLSAVPHSDLDSLCADRPYTSREIVEHNAYYGHDQIYKKYAQAPLTRQLKFSFPHGVEVALFAPFGQRERVPILCYFTPGRPELFRTYGLVGEYHPIATPFHYLAKMLDAADDEPLREGTIFFLNHSGDMDETNAETGRGTATLATRISQLPDQFHPVRVCVYWWDYRLGRAEPFRKAGLEIVTAGHMLDPNFLVRFYRLCRMHRYAMSNEVGSHAFYAIRAGCEYVPLRNARVHVRPPEQFNVDDVLLCHLRDLFDSLDQVSPEAQRRIADYFLGTQYDVPPDALAEFMDYADWRDRSRFAVDRRSRAGLPLIVLPPAWRRTARSLARRAVAGTRVGRHR